MAKNGTEIVGLIRIEAGKGTSVVFGPSTAGDLIRRAGGKWIAERNGWAVDGGHRELIEALEIAGWSVRVVHPRGGARPPVKLRSRTIAGPEWSLRQLMRAGGDE